MLAFDIGIKNLAYCYAEKATVATPMAAPTDTSGVQVNIKHFLIL